MRGLGRHFFGKNPRGSYSLELCRRPVLIAAKKGSPALAKQVVVL